MGQAIEFARPDGSRCGGYAATAGTGRPGVIVIQEWWGLNAQVCGIVDRYAAAGFNALAPDLYHGRVTGDPDEAGHLMQGLDFAGATHQDIAGAIAELAGTSGKLGITGYCMGGALTIAAAARLPGLAAAVCYYGIPPADFADPATIAIPFLGHFATRDAWCTAAAVDALEAAMRAAGRQPELHRYAAEHAFANAARPEVFDAACADLAWQRSLDFFRRHLA